MNGRLRRVFLDLEPLRSDRDYRLLWSGQAVSAIGNQMTRIAVPFQVFVLTNSTIAIGVLSICQLVPILVFALGGGSLADVVDRRRLLLVTQFALASCSLGLLLLALQGSPPVIAIFALATIAAGLTAIDQPARSSSIPRLVPAERLQAAIALNALNSQTASIVGPAIGGILIATIGLQGAFGFDLLTYLASIGALLAIRPLPPILGTKRPGLDAIREGLRYVRQRRVVLGGFVIDYFAMVFGMPTAIFPVLALEVFRVGPAGFGLLAAAPAVGAFLGALTSGWVNRVSHTGRAVLFAVTSWGLAITAFGIVTFSFPLALVCLSIAGASDLFSAVFRSTMIQLETPDGLRGRVTSIHTLVVTSGPRLGDLESSIVAALISPQFAVVSGGVACLLGVAFVARRFPELTHHVTGQSLVSSG